MKKRSLTLLTTAMLSLTSFVCADAASTETPIVEAPKVEVANANRVYAGPEFMWSHFHGNVQKDEDFDFSLKHNVYYGGLRFGHEYLKPDAFYSNTDVVALLGTTHTTEKNKEENKKAWTKTREAFKGERGHLWTNIEQKLGYTFASSLVPSATATVYVAPGFHYEHVDGKHAHWWYGATGLNLAEQFTDHFSLGLNTKVMYAFAARDEKDLALTTTLGKKQFWGYQVEVPFVWTVGACKQFDIQLKPYLLKLNTNSQETNLGARVELGFKF